MSFSFNVVKRRVSSFTQKPSYFAHLRFQYCRLHTSNYAEVHQEDDIENISDCNSLHLSIISILDNKFYTRVPFLMPIILCPLGCYFLSYLDIPLQLQSLMIGLPVMIDISHWYFYQRSLRIWKENAQNLEIYTDDEKEDHIRNELRDINNKLMQLSSFSVYGSIACQICCFSFIFMNPLHMPFIYSLMFSSKIFCGFAPISPMMFTLCTHENTFKNITKDIQSIL